MSYIDKNYILNKINKDYYFTFYYDKASNDGLFFSCLGRSLFFSNEKLKNKNKIDYILKELNNYLDNYFSINHIK